MLNLTQQILKSQHTSEVKFLPDHDYDLLIWDNQTIHLSKFLAACGIYYDLEKILDTDRKTISILLKFFHKKYISSWIYYKINLSTILQSANADNPKGLITRYIKEIKTANPHLKNITINQFMRTSLLNNEVLYSFNNGYFKLNQLATQLNLIQCYRILNTIKMDIGDIRYLEDKIYVNLIRDILTILTTKQFPKSYEKFQTTPLIWMLEDYKKTKKTLDEVKILFSNKFGDRHVLFYKQSFEKIFR